MNALGLRVPRWLASNALPLAFASTIGANVLTMSLANFFQLKTSYLPIIFLGTLFASAVTLIASGITFPTLSKKELLSGAIFSIVLFAPRLSYLYEGWLGYSVNFACFDDWGHIQELSAIAHSDHFPPRSTFDNSKYLSFYYAPWIIGAALYRTGFLLTVKQALGVTILIYQIFFSYFLLYASKVLIVEERQRLCLLVLCALYGGFDFAYWLSGLSIIPSHSEWWATEFGFKLQFSNFFTLALWVPHHFLSALSILFALYVLHSSGKTAAQVFASICFSFGIFSSVFVAVGSVPLICWYFIRHRHLKHIPLILLTFLIICAPLWWIYLGKEAPVGFSLFGALNDFWLEHKRAAFLVFILILSLELLPLIAAALLSPAGRHAERWLIIPALLYLLSTFFIAYSGANNYAMRGSIVPILTLTYAATPTVLAWIKNAPRVCLSIGIACYLSGGLLEYASFSLIAFRNLSASKTAFNRRVLESNAMREGYVSDSLVAAADLYPQGWYLLERLKRKPKATLESWNVELINSDNRYRLTLSGVLSRVQTATRTGDVVRER